MSGPSSPSQNKDLNTMSAPTPTPTPTPSQRKDDHLVIDIPSSFGLHPAFIVNNIKNSIPIVLSRDYGKYVSWVELFRIHANFYNVLDHIDPNTPRPSTVDEPTWERLDTTVKQWIYATISEDLLQAIMTPGASAKELWARLEGIFQHRENSHVYSLKSNLNSTQLGNFPSMELYFERLDELFTQLTNSRSRMSEEMMVDRLISGLTKDKDNAVVAEIQQANPPLSYDEVRSRLLSQKYRFILSTFKVEQHSNLIYKAALGNDWNSVSEIFESNQELMSKAVTSRGETPLMLAVGTNRSHDFVQRLLEKLQPAHLNAKNHEGNTALHYAAKVGNLIDAERLVAQNPDLPSRWNEQRKEPVMLAASLGKKDMLLYLLGVTSLRKHQIIELIPLIIQAGFIDVASLFVFYDSRQLEFDGITRDVVGIESDVLHALAKEPELFRSGSGLGFWGNHLYSLIHVDEIKLKEKILNSAILVQREDGRVILPSSALENITANPTGVWRVLQYIAPPIKNICDIKVKHVQTNLIVKDMCSRITRRINHANASEIYESAIAYTIRYGASELVEECMSTMPFDLEETSLFHLAIQHRHENIYNLVIQTTSHKAFVANYVDQEKRENALHIAAKLAPPDRLNTITGAALQMQREYQWYKEIESFLGPSDRETLNIDEKTPRMIFTDEHKELLKEGREWMKDTSSSCSVVAALVITIAFAAIFTVPGGNKDDGNPMFLNNKVFMLFIISDVIGLFSSSTSVLMFLGILTSRYAEDDFLYALPKRMTIGLIFLFLSLAAILVAFSATLALVLIAKVTWIAAPLVIMTSIPVCLFGWLQFPLLVELVNSTYGRSIFYKHSKRKTDYVQVN